MTSGTGDKAEGRVKKAAGELLDDDELKNEGRKDETRGKVKDAADKAKDWVTKKADEIG